MAREILDPQIAERDPLMDHCGIVILFNPNSSLPNIPIAIKAAGGVQHRGQHGVGILLEDQNNPNDFIRYRRSGLLKDVFYRPLEFEDGETAFSLGDTTDLVMIQARYGTSGGYADYNLQPCQGNYNGKKVNVIVNGQFPNVAALRDDLLSEVPDDASDTFIFAQLLAESPKDTWEERIDDVLDRHDGSYSMAIAVKENGKTVSYLVRDKKGFKPFVLGKIGNGWLIASETHALDKVKVAPLREVKRGELIRLDEDGLTVIKEGFEGSGQFCDFEWDYTARPDSLFPTYQNADDGLHPEQWLSVYESRFVSGEILAQEAPLDLDIVIGVPDSGVPVALGYAKGLAASGSKAYYDQLIIRDHYDENGDRRSFINDEKLDLIQDRFEGKLSLVPQKSRWKGKKVGIVDDSIIRGNVSGPLIRKMYEMGAAEVHWISGYSQVKHPCHLGVSMRAEQRNALIAVRNDGDTERIAAEIGATSVHYISWEGFVTARSGGKEIIKPVDNREIFMANGGCGGCITGVYPISAEGTIYTHEAESL